MVGDSLSAAYGLRAEQGWVALLNDRLTATPRRWTLINASVSGETSAGGLERLPGLLERHKPQLVILALGSNDGLQGKPPALMRTNLTRMVQLSQAAGAQVLLIGNRIPPNYGAVYTERFFASFATVAEQHDVPLIGSLLDAVAEDRTQFQADQLHPTAAAQPLILDTVWRGLEPLLR